MDYAENNNDAIARSILEDAGYTHRAVHRDDLRPLAQFALMAGWQCG